MTNSEVLSNKPLVEAIFEIRWELSSANTFAPAGMPTDALYDISIGKLAERLKYRFPMYLRLPAAAIPGSMMPHQPQHQLRSSNGGWPLVQLGAGILTVNETETYTSGNFIPMCLEILDILRNFWSENNYSPRFIYTALRYIDALEMEGNSVPQVLAKLDVNFDYGERIKSVPNIGIDFEALQLNSRFKSISPDGHIDLSFNRGLKRDVDALIWETTISSEDEKCSVFQNDPSSWLQAAHSTAHNLFFSMIAGELHERFK